MTEEDRAFMKAQLVILISAYSEDRYCAGWMGGIEDELLEEGGIWRLIADALGEWPYRGKDTDYQVEWRPLPEVNHG